MKPLLLIGITVSSFSAATAQHTQPQLLEVFGKRYHYYIEMGDNMAVVHKMTRWLDKAGDGFAIRLTDTAVKQPGGSFTGSLTRIETGQDKQYLVFRENENSTATKKAVIKPVAKPQEANLQMNNGYWFGKFFRLSNNINARFTSCHYSFREGIPVWKSFTNTQLPYREFFPFVDSVIKKISDTIIAVQTMHTRRMQYLTGNMATMDYAVFKDSLAQLPPANDYNNRHFRHIITAVCDQRPEWFFRLAEDMPQQKSDIFFIGSTDKATAKKLLAVNTASPAKKEFAKELRWEKGYKIKLAVIYGGLLGLGIYALVK